MTRPSRSRAASAIAYAFAVSSASLVAVAAHGRPPSPEHAQPHAHVHGVARLGMAIQDKTLTIQLVAPLDSLIGFEHPPDTPAQKAAVAALRAKMQAPRELFRFNLAARCTLARSEADSAIFRAPASAGARGDGHADLDASFEFHCANPSKLAALDTGLFAAYPRLKRLDVDVAPATARSSAS